MPDPATEVAGRRDFVTTSPNKEVPDPTTEVAGRRDFVNTSPNKEVPYPTTEVAGRRDLADSSLPGEVSAPTVEVGWRALVNTSLPGEMCGTPSHAFRERVVSEEVEGGRVEDDGSGGMARLWLRAVTSVLRASSQRPFRFASICFGSRPRAAIFFFEGPFMLAKGPVVPLGASGWKKLHTPCRVKNGQSAVVVHGMFVPGRQHNLDLPLPLLLLLLPFPLPLLLLPLRSCSLANCLRMAAMMEDTSSSLSAFRFFFLGVSSAGSVSETCTSFDRLSDSMILGFLVQPTREPPEKSAAPAVITL